MSAVHQFALPLAEATLINPEDVADGTPSADIAIPIPVATPMFAPAPAHVPIEQGGAPSIDGTIDGTEANWPALAGMNGEVSRHRRIVLVVSSASCLSIPL